MSGRIFINYRRDDSSGTAGRLNDRLVRRFGRQNLFMDVDNTPAGVDFVKYLDARVGACDVFLAVIGPNWLEAKDAGGRRRIDDPHDYVSVEIAAALQRDIRVIPVLIDGAILPRSEDLPEALKPLVRRHAVEVRNAQFGRDADALAEKVHEGLKSQRRARRGWRRWLAGALVLLLLAGAALIYRPGMLPVVSHMLGFSAAPNALHDLLLARLAAYAVADAERQAAVQKYEAEAAHKALVISLETHHTWRTRGWPTSPEAETGALEGCQIVYGKPCALVATDDTLTTGDDVSRVREMPRPRYAGTFDPRQIPRARSDFLKRVDVLNYASAPEPKAAAFHPEGSPFVVIVTAASSQFDAEDEALAKCNAIPKESGGLCFLYAIGNQVVLPRRSVKPLTPR
jgi:hypothetical protein